MEGIEEGAVKAIANLAREGTEARVIEEDGQRWLYYQGKLQVIQYDPQPECLVVNNLPGLVELLKRKPAFSIDDLIAIVDDVGVVSVHGPESEKTRKRPIVALAKLDGSLQIFPFGRWLDQETFLISVYSQLIRDAGDFAQLVAYASNVSDDEAITQTDDGVSQSAVLKRGLKGGAAGEVRETAPSIVRLQPYRTFREIDQPEGLFVFRMRKTKEGVAFALFEADGGAWRLEARANIRDYLEEQLPEMIIA